jgi:hypothetical protein
MWYSEYCEYGTGPPHGNRADASTHEYVREPLGRRRSLQCSPSRAAPGFHSDTALARTCVFTAPAGGRLCAQPSKSKVKLHARVFVIVGSGCWGLL